ncbi:MAG: benzoate/H(+) symporter BenE family transporter [Rubrivivax sp.]
MFSHLERPAQPAPGLRQVLADIGPRYVANGFIGWVFSATAPVAIILAVGSGGGLSEAELASWIFGVFFVNGLTTLLFSWLYRAPLGFAWTIPGTVLVGPALAHLRFAEVVGAFYATGLLMLVLGATGWVKRAMQAVPMPLVMGMVAGVFLRFGLDLVRALHADAGIAAPMVAVWLLLTAVPALGRRLPPMIGALLVGAAAIALLGRMDMSGLHAVEIVRPVFQAPVWSLPAMIELVIPLAITVLVVQNGQGFAVLKAARHDPPIDAITVASGVASIAAAAVGAVSSCLTGPTNGILVSSGERARQYTAALSFGGFAVLFGLLSPSFTRLMLATPKAFIMTLAGLAMLRVLQGAFVTAFQTRFSLGALVALLVTVADLGLWNIGAAFWGLVAGFGTSWLLERADFQALRAAKV